MTPKIDIKVPFGLDLIYTTGSVRTAIIAVAFSGSVAYAFLISQLFITSSFSISDQESFPFKAFPLTSASSV